MGTVEAGDGEGGTINNKAKAKAKAKEPCHSPLSFIQFPNSILISNPRRAPL